MRAAQEVQAALGLLSGGEAAVVRLDEHEVRGGGARFVFASDHSLIDPIRQ
jgi:hypothetical protein